MMIKDIDHTKERKEKYRKERDITRQREIFTLRLRKDKLEEKISERRFASHTQNVEDNEKYAIRPSELNLGNDFTECFFKSDNKLEQALGLIAESEESMRKFGIRQLRNFTETLKKKDNIDDIFQSYNYNDLINLLVNTTDLKELFETSLIMINLAQHSGVFSNYIARNHLKEIFNKMVSVKECLFQNHILNILSNIVAESPELHELVHSTVDLIGYVTNTIKAEHLPQYFKLTLIWTIGNLYKHPDQRIFDLVKPIIPDIARLIKSNLDSEIFSEALHTLSKIARASDEENIECLIESQVHLNLIPYISSKTGSFELDMIFGIIGNVACVSDRFIEEMFQKKILPTFETVLEESLIQIKNQNVYLKKNKIMYTDFIWCLSNFAAVNMDSILNYLIRKTKIPALLLQLTQITSNKSIQANVLQFYTNALEGMQTNIKTELLRLGVLELFCHQLQHSQEVDIQKLCLRSLHYFLIYGATIMKDRNIVKEEMESMGVNTVIENLQQSNDDEIGNTALSLIQRYFTTEDVGGQI